MSVYQRTHTDRRTGLPVPYANQWVVDVSTPEGRLKTQVASKKAAQELERRWKRGETQGHRATGPKAPPPRLAELVLPAASALYRGKSAGYKATQEARMWRFVRWAKAQAGGVDVSPDWVTARELHRWVDYLQEFGHDGAPLSNSTINAKVVAVRSLLDWCHTRGHRQDPAPKVPQLELKNTAPGYLTLEEEDQIVATIRALGRPVEADFIRAQAMSGMRRGELLGLLPGDLGADQVFLRQQKSGTPGAVPIVPEVARILLRRVPWQCTEVTLRYWLIRAKEELGWDKSPELRLRSITLHSMRHTAATRLVEAGVDMRIIKDILRHADLRHTLRYTKVRPGLATEKVQVLSRALPEEAR